MPLSVDACDSCSFCVDFVSTLSFAQSLTKHDGPTYQPHSGLIIAATEATYNRCGQPRSRRCLTDATVNRSVLFLTVLCCI